MVLRIVTTNEQWMRIGRGVREKRGGAREKLEPG